MQTTASPRRRKAPAAKAGSQIAFDAERACRAAGITDPVAELPLLVKLASTARQFRAASTRYNSARQAWSSFAARGDEHDPLHEEHRQRVLAARNALTTADEEFCYCEQQLALARGDILPGDHTAPTDRLAAARRIVALAGAAA